MKTKLIALLTFATGTLFAEPADQPVKLTLQLEGTAAALAPAPLQLELMAPFQHGETFPNSLEGFRLDLPIGPVRFDYRVDYGYPKQEGARSTFRNYLLASPGPTYQVLRARLSKP